jgi:hypothetical protein
LANPAVAGDKIAEQHITNLDAYIPLKRGTHQFVIYAVSTDGTLWYQTTSVTVQ